MLAALTQDSPSASARCTASNLQSNPTCLSLIICFRHLYLLLLPTRHKQCGYPAATMAEASLVYLYSAMEGRRSSDCGVIPLLLRGQPNNLFILSVPIGLAPLVISSQAQESKLPPSAEGEREGVP